MCLRIDAIICCAVVCLAAATFVPIVASSASSASPVSLSADSMSSESAVAGGSRLHTDPSVAAVGGRSHLLPSAGEQGSLQVDDSALVPLPDTTSDIETSVAPKAADADPVLDQRPAAVDGIQPPPKQDDDSVLLTARQVYYSRPFAQLMASAVLFGGAFSGILPHVPIFIAEHVSDALVR